FIVIVLQDRILQPLRQSAGILLDCTIEVELEGALLEPPAVVATALDAVQVLQLILPHIAGEKLTAGKGEAVNVAQSKRIDLLRTAALRKGIVFRDSVLAVGCVRSAHVDAQQFAQ